jgi:hypothetical protein
VPEREYVVRSPVCAPFGCCGLGYGFGLAGRDGCWPVEVAGADERKTGERAAITVVTEAERTDRERSPGDTVPTAALRTAITHPSPLPIASTLALRAGAAHRPAALTQRRRALKSARDPLSLPTSGRRSAAARGAAWPGCTSGLLSLAGWPGAH